MTSPDRRGPQKWDSFFVTPYTLPESVAIAGGLWSVLRQAPPLDPLDTRGWTDRVAHAVASLCPPGLNVFGKQWAREGRREYLVDQCWREFYVNKAETHGYPGAMRFAMECEWLRSPKEQMYDFRKLLDVRADRALYVAGLYKWGQFEQVVPSAVLASQHSMFYGEVVLYLFDRTNPADRFEVWIYGKKRPGSRVSMPLQFNDFIKETASDSSLSNDTHSLEKILEVRGMGRELGLLDEDEDMALECSRQAGYYSPKQPGRFRTGFGTPD